MLTCSHHFGLNVVTILASNGSKPARELLLWPQQNPFQHYLHDFGNFFAGSCLGKSGRAPFSQLNKGDKNAMAIITK